MPADCGWFFCSDIQVGAEGDVEYCGLNIHTFNLADTMRNAQAWEHDVAEALLKEPRTVIVADDMGRLSQNNALEYVGNLMCGGNGMFKTAADQAVDSSKALFIITSDMSIDSESQFDCDEISVKKNLDVVKQQFDEFRRKRKGVRFPAAWHQSQLVPFTPLCVDDFRLIAKRFLEKLSADVEQRLRREVEKMSGNVEMPCTNSYGRCTVYSTYMRWFSYAWSGSVEFSTKSVETLGHWVKNRGVCEDETHCTAGAHPFNRELEANVVPIVLDNAPKLDKNSNQTLINSWKFEDAWSSLPGWGYYRTHSSSQTVCLSVACQDAECNSVDDNVPDITVELAEEAGTCPTPKALVHTGSAKDEL